MEFLAFIVLGALAGWISGLIMRGYGFGLLGDIIVGIIGAVLGGWLFSLFGVHSYTFVGSLVTAIVGSIVLIALVRSLKRM